MTYEDFIQHIVETRGQWADEVRYSREGCERHHIIPKSKGGKPEVLTWEPHGNIIWLYPREHYMAHKLLYLEHPHDYGLYAAWLGTTKNNTISEDDYAEIKKYSHNFPPEILEKIAKAGEFKYRIRKDLLDTSNKRQYNIKDPEAFKQKKRELATGKNNSMYGHGEKISGGKNGHASIRYFYDGKTFECRNDLLKYLWGIGINITASAIRKLVHGTGTYRVYSMYPEVFDNLTWEYKEGSDVDED